MSDSPRAVVDPIEVISAAQHRIATLAAIQAAAKGMIPSVAAMVLAVMLTSIGNLTWARWGYLLGPEVTAGIRVGLWAGAIAGLIASAIAARRAFRAQAFVEAAARVDRIAAAKEEVLTLALLADPSRARDSSRSPLFPILWRRAAEKLHRFEISTAFRLEVAPSIRSGLMASLALIVLLACLLGLMIRPTSALSDAAQHMLETANSLDKSASGSADSKRLADRLREAARALNDSSLTREDKLEQIAAISQELEQRQQPQSKEAGQQPMGKPPGNQSARSQSGSGSGQAKGDKQGQSGSGSGGSANGEASGSEPGSGSNQAGNDKGVRNPSNKGDSNTQGNRSDQQIAELSKDLQRDRQKLEGHDSSPNAQQGGGNDPNQRENHGNAPRASQNRNQSGSPKPGSGTQKGAGGRPGQKDSNQVDNAAATKPNGDQARNDTGGTSGDTHLGQFPTPGKFERFYKPGDKGEPLEIKNARYVLFRIPPATALDGSGKIVKDTDQPTASTPYTNAPLKDERLSSTPDERQLIPLRYRDLLR